MQGRQGVTRRHEKESLWRRANNKSAPQKEEQAVHDRGGGQSNPGVLQSGHQSTACARGQQGSVTHAPPALSYIVSSSFYPALPCLADLVHVQSL